MAKTTTADRAPGDAQERGFRAADLLGQAMIQGLDVADDGSCVVYSRRVIEDNAYRTRLWRVGFDGGDAESLTTGDANDSRPRVSPDGRSLLFLSDRSGRTQPWVLPMRGGEPRRLAEFPGDARAADWSPDGERVLVVALSGEERYVVGDADDPIARRIVDFSWRLDGSGFRDQFASAYVVDTAGGSPLRLTEPAYEVIDAFWSPDGERIGLVADLDPDAALATFAKHARVWSLPSGAPGAAPDLVASLNGSVATAKWSTGGVLAIVGVDHPRAPSWANDNLYLVVDGDVRQVGTELDRPIANVTFGDLIDPGSEISFEWVDDRHVVAIMGDEGRSVPIRLEMGNGAKPERMAEGEIVCSAIAAGGGRVVVVATEHGRPGEVYAVENGELRQLTTNGSAWLEAYRKDPERIRIEHPEGHTIDAWFIPGRGAERPGPLVVQIHGGPHGAHGPTPWLEMLALADAGIHVLYPNPRGSAGYGEEFARAIHGVWGDPDAADHLRVVEWAVGEGIADPARLGVLGLSGGGYMVTWLLGHAPGTFAAGVSENPVTDLVGWYGSSDLPTYTDDRFIGVGTLPDDLDAFLRRSPYLEIHRNTAPLLLLQSEADLRCPPGQTELVFAILRSRDRIVEMVRYPNEPHYLVGVGRPDRRVDRIERIVSWFDRYL